MNQILIGSKWVTKKEDKQQVHVAFLLGTKIHRTGSLLYNSIKNWKIFLTLQKTREKYGQRWSPQLTIFGAHLQQFVLFLPADRVEENFSSNWTPQKTGPPIFHLGQGLHCTNCSSNSHFLKLWSIFPSELLSGRGGEAQGAFGQTGLALNSEHPSQISLLKWKESY